jgi:hypothetical protein
MTTGATNVQDNRQSDAANALSLRRRHSHVGMAGPVPEFPFLGGLRKRSAV